MCVRVCACTCVYLPVHKHVCARAHMCTRVCLRVRVFSFAHASELALAVLLFANIISHCFHTSLANNKQPSQIINSLLHYTIFFTRFYCKLNFPYISHLRSSKWLKILRLQPFSPSKFCNMSPVLSKRRYFKEDISPKLSLSSFRGTCVCRLDDCKIFVLLFSPFFLWETFLICYL